MSRTLILLFLPAIALINCQDKNQSRKFEPPVFVSLTVSDSIPQLTMRVDSLVDVYPPFIGKFKFGDTVDLNQPVYQTAYRNDFIGGYHIDEDDSLDTNGLDIVVDYDKSLFYSKWYFDPEIWIYQDTLWEYFPVYIVNASHSDKVLTGKDASILGIQEAKDDGYSWRPIESSGEWLYLCGNGHFGVILHPNEFAVFLMRKYEGAESMLRVRINFGESTVVSKRFKGRVNPSQFQITKNSYAYQQISRNRGVAPYWLFYGAQSKLEENWHKGTK